MQSRSCFSDNLKAPVIRCFFHAKEQSPPIKKQLPAKEQLFLFFYLVPLS